MEGVLLSINGLMGNKEIVIKIARKLESGYSEDSASTASDDR